MGASEAAANMNEEPSALEEQERAFLDAYVDAAVEPYRDQLPPADLAWMREQILAAVYTDPELLALARAAAPRSVDSSAEILRRPVLSKSVPPGGSDPTDKNS
jgi:hypothetical protein